MKKLFYLWIALSIVHSSSAQVTFIGELRNEGKPTSFVPWTDPDVQILYCNFRVRDNEKHDNNIEAFLYPKEIFYGTATGTGIIFRLDEVTATKRKEIFIYGSSYHALMDLQEGKRMVREYWSKRVNLDKRRMTPIVENKAYKLDDPIIVSDPEKFSLISQLNYLYLSLNDRDNADNFAKTKNRVALYEGFPELISQECTDSANLTQFFKLYLFLENYASPKSFFRLETKKLKRTIDSLQVQLTNRKDSSRYLESHPQYSTFADLAEDYASSIYVYEQSQKTQIEVDKLYNILKKILFTPCIELNKLKDSIKTNILASLQKFRSGENRVCLAFGSSVSILTESVYNVTISSIDTTVQFEKISKTQTALSLGIVAKPFSKKQETQLNADGSYLVGNGFTLGAFLNYYISPTSTQNFSASLFGLSFGTGYTLNNFNLFSTVSFRQFRSPQEYFVNRFKDQNRKLPNLDSTSLNARRALLSSDNSIFIDKWKISFGIAVTYSFPFYRRRY